MKLISSHGNKDLSIVYVAQTANNELIEFVESLQPPKTREEKWVLILSVLYGCAVKCKMCDAGSYYRGRLSKEAIFWQIDNLISRRYHDGKVPSKLLKVQFTRMGEPAFNSNVLKVIDEFDIYFNAPGFMPSISTIAPKSTDGFFEEMLEIKNNKFNHGNFQLQFSIHTTDEILRDELIPVKKWSFKEISNYGSRFYTEEGRKISLSFAASIQYPVIPELLLQYFDPAKFLIKLTPLNPTYSSKEAGLTSVIDELNFTDNLKLADDFRTCGYELIISLGEFEENYIGSNCGQNIITHAVSHDTLETAYPKLDEDLKLKINEIVNK